MIVPTILLIAGLALTGLGCATWRTSGRRLVLLGTAFVTFGAFNLLRDSGSGVRYALATVFAAVVVTTLLTSGRDVLRRARLELALLGATALALAASYFLTNVSSELHEALLVLFAVLMVASIAAMFVRPLRALRSVETSKPN